MDKVLITIRLCQPLLPLFLVLHGKVSIAVGHGQVMMTHHLAHVLMGRTGEEQVGAVCGHVFCSFSALILMKELEERLEEKGCRVEWKDVIRDFDQLEEVEIEQDRKRFVLRTQCKGACGKVFQAAGVALPPTLRQVHLVARNK